MIEPELRHTYGRKEESVDGIDRCPLCPGDHGGPGPCDHSRTRRKRRRFDLVPWHLEETLNALINPDRSAASAVMERQNEEFRSLPSRHICTCECPNVNHGRPSCEDCRKRRANEVPQVTIEIGRTAAVHPPSPHAATLDLLLGKL